MTLVPPHREVGKSKWEVCIQYYSGRRERDCEIVYYEELALKSWGLRSPVICHLQLVDTRQSGRLFCCSVEAWEPGKLVMKSSSRQEMRWDVLVLHCDARKRWIPPSSNFCPFQSPNLGNGIHSTTLGRTVSCTRSASSHVRVTPVMTANARSASYSWGCGLLQSPC